MLIKYEDLLANPYREFIKLSEYLSKLLSIKFENEKIDTAVKSNSFLEPSEVRERKWLFRVNNR